MKKYISWLILLLAIIPHSLFAYTAINWEWQLRIENNINDNLYTAWGKVDVLGNITGDLILAGGELMVHGNISDNAIIAGGNVETSGIFGNDLIIVWGDIRIKSPVLGDIKATGGSIILENSASGDVNIAAWTIRITKGVIIEKDLGIAGGSIVINGLIKWKADIFAGNLDFDGIITKDVSLRISDTKNLHIGPNAKIMGKLTYKAPERVPALEKIAIQWATYGGIPEFSNIEENNKEMLYGFVSIYLLYKFLFLLVVGSLLLCVFKDFFRNTAIILQEHIGKSFLFGLLYFILMPIITILCFITVIWIPIGFLSLAIYIFSFVFAKVITLVVISELINTTWQNKISKSWQKWGVFILLAIILTLINGIDFIATIFVSGALMLKLWSVFSKKAIRA